MPPPPPPLSLFLEALVIILGKLITHPVWFQNSVVFFFLDMIPAYFFAFTIQPTPTLPCSCSTFARGFRWACCKLSIWWNKGFCRTVFSRDSLSWVGVSPLSFSLACSLSTASKARWVSAEKLSYCLNPGDRNSATRSFPRVSFHVAAGMWPQQKPRSLLIGTKWGFMGGKKMEIYFSLYTPESQNDNNKVAIILFIKIIWGKHSCN